jgi:hypothetical protein
LSLIKPNNEELIRNVKQFKETENNDQLDIVSTEEEKARLDLLLKNLKLEIEELNKQKHFNEEKANEQVKMIEQCKN